MSEQSVQILDELEAILTLQCDITGRLLEFASVKEHALIGGDIADLKAVLEDEEDTVFEFSACENKRIKKVNEFQKSIGRKPALLSLTEMLMLVEDHNKSEKIAEIGSRLNELARRLCEQNAKLNRIIRVKRDYVDVMLEALTGNNEPETQNYDVKGAAVRNNAETGPGMLEIFA